MAYSAAALSPILCAMNRADPHGLQSMQSVSDLRELYRAAESRAARLRLLIEAGRDLATADRDTLPAVLAESARAAALFVGALDGSVELGGTSIGVPLIAPGNEGRRVGSLIIDDGALPAPAVDREDAAAIGLLAQLMGAAIDRIAHEREREHLVTLLQERERRLEDVVSRLFSAQEEERRRVSRELHDGVAQTASALFRSLESCALQTGDAILGDLAGVSQGLVRELRAVIGGLRPTALDDLGLQAAVSALLDLLSAEGYQVVYAASGPARWPSIFETAYFRVAQEAINNIRRHAGGPCRVEAELTADEALTSFSLRIRDYGAGFSPVPARQGVSPDEHLGLHIMRERMNAIGGAFVVHSAPGQGVEIEASVKTRLS